MIHIRWVSVLESSIGIGLILAHPSMQALLPMRNALSPAIGKPAAFSHQKPGCIVTRLRRTSVMERGGDFPFLKEVILRVPGKNEEGNI
jgi:hypothetical protein